MKEIIISYYDGGYWWSFASGNRKYNRDDYRDGKLNKYIRVHMLAYCLEEYPLNDELIASVVKHIWPKCERIILCEDGGIDILNLQRGKTNGN